VTLLSLASLPPNVGNARRLKGGGAEASAATLGGAEIGHLKWTALLAQQRAHRYVYLPGASTNCRWKRGIFLRFHF